MKKVFIASILTIGLILYGQWFDKIVLGEQKDLSSDQGINVESFFKTLHERFLNK